MEHRPGSAFVGRAVELSALQGAHRDPTVQTVLVTGPAGIGKSRLVAEFAARLDSRTVVLTGRCPEFGNDGMPFAPFVTIMRTLMRRHDAAHLAELLPGPRPALSRWLPELATQSGSIEHEPEPIRLFAEILTLLERLAMAQPVVLVLEDLHWADDSSWKLLTFLVANLAEQDVLLICTYRPGGAGQLRSVVAELQRNAGVRLIAPEPLTKHEVGRQLAALYGREPEPGVIARVFERSGGNPLFVEALSQSSGQTPAGLSELLLVGPSTLPADTRAVLRLAAVAGSPADHALLEAAAELPQAVLYEALRQLVDQQILVATGAAYEFRHILIRQAVYDDILPIERARLHSRLSRVLSQRPALLPEERHSAALAYHAFAARDLPLALRTSWQAAALGERAGAQPERLHHLERVLELWDMVPEAARLLNVDRLTVLEHAVDAAHHCRAIDRGIHAADEALDLLDEDVDPVRAAHLLYRRARLRNQGSGGGRDDLLHALELLPTEPPTPLRGHVLAELALTLVFVGAMTDAREHARAAAEIAERLGTPSLAARAYAHLGLATTADDPAAAIEHFTRAHTAAADDTRTLLTVLVWESAALVAAGDYLAAIETVQRGLRAAHETFRFVEEGPVLIVKWNQALTALGRWSEASSLIDDALTEQLPPLATAALLIGHARILLDQGHPATAQAGLDTAERLLGDSPWTRQYQLELRWVQCRMALQNGEPRLASRILAETLSAGDLALHPHEAWPLLVVGAQVQAALAHPPARTAEPGAADLAARMTTLASSLPSVSAVDAAHRKVMAAATSADPSTWDDAVRSWRSLRRPYEQAQCLFEAARAHLAAGNRTAARSALSAAVGIADQIGAAPLGEAVEQLATRARLNLDRPSPTASAAAADTTDADLLGLTRRELDVLRLVARGMSNRQIAAELFISGNTAGVHVSRILGKLGVATRTQAAAIAHRHNLVTEESP
jgi:DNA-binding CsgD family transcriptional regulator/tetratricopeptide (TPR) repeat protein